MPATRIWTIGHSTRSADAFVDLLRTHQIDRLADIRTIPQSRRHPHFGREALDRLLREHGVQYRHFRELGGLRKPKADSANGGWKNPAFRGYADHMETAEFSDAVDELLAEAGTRPAAVMCAESVWWCCHRRLLADAAVLLPGAGVEHLFHDGRLDAHRPTAEARVDGQRLVYDGGAPGLPLRES